MLKATGGLALVLALLFLWQGVTAALALNEAKVSAAGLSSAIARGDVEQAKARLSAFDREVTRAHDRTDGPLWWLGARVPLVGPSIDAISTIAAQSDAIADEALPEIVDVADQVQLETFRPKNGRIDLRAVARALPVLATTDRVMSNAAAAVSELRADKVIGPLQQPVREFQSRTHEAATAVATVHDAGELLPVMLGGQGSTRRYLLMVLNNSEIRSLGGMPGSFAVVEARRGRIEMTEQAGTTDLKSLDEPVLSAKPEVRGGINSAVAVDIRETAISPDFPRAARFASSIAGEFWETDFDGVVAVDPIALGYVLGAVGGVDIGDGLTIDRSNAATTLLSGIYLRYPDDNAKRDAAFENAARRTFDALTDGRGNSVMAVRALVRGVQERRIMLWSKHPAEQKRIRSTGIAGSLTDVTQLERPQIGVYLTDTTQAKMDFYLRMGTHVESKKCYRGGYQDITVTTTIRSDAPQGRSTLPDAVVGFGNRVARGDLGLSIRIVAPPNGKIRSVEVDGRRAPVGAASYLGRPMTRLSRVLTPGESSIIVSQIRTGPKATGSPLLRTTPGVLANDDVVGPTACD